MPNNANDLAIYIKTLLHQDSITSLKKTVGDLIKEISEKSIKLNITLDDKIISTLNNFSKAMENIKTATQQGNTVASQHTQIIKELDGSIKKYTETVKENGKVVQKTTEILDKNKIAKQQNTQVINNIKTETDAVNKLNSEYGKLIRNVKIKNSNKETTRQDLTYQNQQTGIKTTVTSRPGQENTYKIDNNLEQIKNNTLKEQMKLARESAKLAKESNDYQQKYYKVQQKTFEENNKEFARGIKLREKAEKDYQKVQQKIFDEGNKEFLRGIKLRQSEEIKQYKVKDTTQAQKDKFNAELYKLNNSKSGQYVDKVAEQNIKDMIASLNNLNKTSLGKIKTEIDALAQKANNDFNKTKDNIVKTEQQLNKLNNIKIKSLKLEAKVNLLPSGEVGVEKLKKSLEAYKNIISKSEFKIKNGEFISEQQLRNLDFAREKLNILQVELKRIFSTSSTGASAKAIKLFDFNTATSELNKFKSEVDKIKSSLSVGGNVVNKSTIDEFGRLNLEIRNQAGFIEKIKYQWDTVAQSLHKVNIEQNQNNDALKAFKISNVKDLADLGRKYKGIVNKEDIKNIVDYIRNIQVLDQATKSMVKGKIENLQFKVSNADSINKEIERISKQLNTKMQNALNLGVKFGNLSPEQLAPLEKALNRYKTLINDMKQKSISGQIVSDKDIERLQRLENAIKRVYDQTRISSKDSRGFNFEQYPKMQNAVQGATNAQNYYNQSIMQGKKLLEANVQETEKYIKVTQRLRQGSEITNISAYINKATGETHKFSESMKDLMTRTWDLGSAFKTALEKFTIWMATGTIIFQSWHFLKDGISYVNQYNKALTELSMVYMKTQDQVEGLGEKLHKLSVEMGISTQEVAKGAVEFARQGLSQEESIKRMETAIKYAKISNLDFSTSARILTATVNSMGISAEKAADVFSYMG